MDLNSVSGWYRLDYKEWVLFLKAKSHDGTLRSGHEHSDLISFVLYYNGEIILNDPGRLDYTNSSLSRYGVSPLAHNTLLLDGIGPEATKNPWFAKEYLELNVKVTKEYDSTGYILKIKHNGFRRIANKDVRHQRILKLMVDEVLITDKLIGKGEYNMITRFHFLPKLYGNSDLIWNIDKTNLKFKCCYEADVKINNGKDTEPFGGLYFPNYGQMESCTTLELSRKIDLPFTAIYSIKKYNGI